MKAIEILTRKDVHQEVKDAVEKEMEVYWKEIKMLREKIIDQGEIIRNLKRKNEKK